jgi:hypothetical protein
MESVTMRVRRRIKMKGFDYVNSTGVREWREMVTHWRIIPGLGPRFVYLVSWVFDKDDVYLD